MKKITLLIALLFAFYANSQTALTAGDIAFVGSNADGSSNAEDNVSFVLLKDIDAATTIIFTDMGWNDTTGFFTAAGDGSFTWTSGVARTAGEVVTINMGPLAPAAYSVIGDQMFAIQGSLASPIFIAGLQFNDASGDDTNWDGAATSNSTSALPNELITGFTAVRLIPEMDNWQFSCTLAGGPVSGTPAEIRELVNDRTNWVGNDTTVFNPVIPAGCTFTITLGGDTIPPVIVCAPTPAPITAGLNGLAAIPDLVSGTTATDNVSIPANITITQSPTAGTMVGVGINTVTLTAMDEAGNSASCTIDVTVNEPPFTTLAPGDIAFVGFNLDGNDSFAFIVLKDIIAGTNIKFTDCGVSNPNTITCAGAGGEGSATWYAPSAMLAGDIVTLPGSFITGSVLSQVGDQIFAYQGTAAAPSFITAIHGNVEPGVTTDADWDGENTTNSNSALPDQLTNGVNAIRVYGAGETEIDNWQFDCTQVPGGFPITGTAIELSAIINDIQYWVSNDVTEYNPAAKAGCLYTVLPPDTTPPTAVCQDITVQLDANGNATIIATAVDGGSTDNVGIISYAIDIDTFDCSNVGTPVTVTLTVTDAAGNSATCEATVTVEDNIDPTAVCQAFTAQLDATGSVTITAADIDNGSSDACGIASLSISPSTFTCANIGANTVTLTVTDVNGNVSTCTSTVTVEDNVAPTASCQDITVSLDATGNASITAADIDNGSVDNCGIQSLSVSPSSFSCANIGPNTVTLTVTDVNGNVSTCTATVTVEDIINPIASCQDFTVSLDASGNASIVAADIDNGSSDNCGIQSIAVAPNSFTCNDIGANTVTLTVTDVNGNSSTCTATVTVTDPLSACNLPPVAVCQPVIVNADGSCFGNAVATDFDGGSTDPDGDPLTFTVNPVGPYPVGVTNVVLTVSDGIATDTCTTTITVIDNTPPTANCAAPFTVQLDGNGNASITAADINNGSTDNCGIASTTIDITTFDCSNIGDNTVTLTVTDVNGNVSTCTTVVTVEDTMPPIAVCAAGVAVYVGSFQVNDGPYWGNNPPVYSGQEAAALLFGGVPSDYWISTNPNTTDPNTITRTAWHSAWGVSGCNEHPDTYSFDAGAPGYNDPGGNNTASSAFVNDNCLSGVNYVWRVNVITLELDANGQAVLDPALIDGGSTDNCGIANISVSPDTFTCADVGPNTVTLTVTDVNGNSSSCTSNIFVEDNIAPVAVCQNITVQLDAAGNATITAADVDGGSSDACGIADLSIDISTFDCSNVGANNVVLTVTDENGNISSCTAVVTVEDNVAPVANCAAPFTIQLDATGNASITLADIENGSTDACGIASTSIDITDFDCSNVGPNTVTLTVTDVNGNISTCTTIVTVEDNIDPIANCAAPFTIQLDANGVATITVADIDNGSNDACGIASTSIDISSFDCSDVGPNTVTLTVTDVNGNTSTCTTIVTVEDNVAPVANCAAPFTIQLDANGEASITVADIDNGSTDACGIASTSIDITDFDCSNVGPNTVTLTVVDNNGNISTCTTIVTVEDSLPPTLACPADITINTTAGLCSATVSFPMPIALDNCGISTVVQTMGSPSGSQFPVGVTTIEFTATDVNGNSSTCSFTITVVDNEAPVAVCQNITIQLDANGNATITAADVDGGSTDQCGVASISIDIDTFDCSDVGDNNVILTVTDVNGNSSSCTAIVTVEDITAPVVACQDISVELDPVTGTVTITGSDIDNGSTDACGIASYTLDIDTFDCSNIGDNTVVLTVTDVNGNSASCTAIVTVMDNTAPTLVCQDFTIEIGADGTATLNPSDVIASNDDACGIFTVAVDITEFSCADIGNPVTVQVFSQDNNGNLSTCTAIVTAVDLLAPVLTCPLDQIVDPGAGNLFYIVPDYFATGEATAIDNCTDPVTLLTQSPAPGTALPDGVYTITFTATDEYGNTSTCDFELTVETTIGIEEQNLSLSSIVLYPVPTNNTLNISNPQGLDLQELEIYDLRGRLVQKADLRGMGSLRTIDVEPLNAAVYMVKIKGESSDIWKRLIKE